MPLLCKKTKSQFCGDNIINTREWTKKFWCHSMHNWCKSSSKIHTWIISSSLKRWHYYAWVWFTPLIKDTGTGHPIHHLYLPPYDINVKGIGNQKSDILRSSFFHLVRVSSFQRWKSKPGWPSESASCCESFPPLFVCSVWPVVLENSKNFLYSEALKCQ